MKEPIDMQVPKDSGWDEGDIFTFEGEVVNGMVKVWSGDHWSLIPEGQEFKAILY